MTTPSDRPAFVTTTPWLVCGTPGDCDWRPYLDTDQWVRCVADGCGVEARAEELDDQDGDGDDDGGAA